MLKSVRSSKTSTTAAFETDGYRWTVSRKESCAELYTQKSGTVASPNRDKRFEFDSCGVLNGQNSAEFKVSGWNSNFCNDAHQSPLLYWYTTPMHNM